MPEFTDARVAFGDDVTPRRRRRGRADRDVDSGDHSVEVAPLLDGGVTVRNSHHQAGPVLVYTRAEMTAFILGVKDGDFDDLLAEGAGV